MGGAGMTVGGFYSHFTSKQELVAEAISEALCQSRRRMADGAGDRKGEEWVMAVVRSYLSRFHRDHPEQGCPLPATLGEVAREEGMVREVLEREVEETIAVIAAHLEEAGAEDPRAEALALFSTMIGGLTMARALEARPSPTRRSKPAAIILSVRCPDPCLSFKARRTRRRSPVIFALLQVDSSVT